MISRLQFRMQMDSRPGAWHRKIDWSSTELTKIVKIGSCISIREHKIPVTLGFLVSKSLNYLPLFAYSALKRTTAIIFY